MTVGRLLVEASCDEISEWIALAIIDNEADKERELQRDLERDAQDAMAEHRARRGRR